MGFGSFFGFERVTPECLDIPLLPFLLFFFLLLIYKSQNGDFQGKDAITKIFTWSQKVLLEYVVCCHSFLFYVTVLPKIN